MNIPHTYTVVNQAGEAQGTLRCYVDAQGTCRWEWGPVPPIPPEPGTPHTGALKPREPGDDNWTLDPNEDDYVYFHPVEPPPEGAVGTVVINGRHLYVRP